MLDWVQKAAGMRIALLRGAESQSAFAARTGLDRTFYRRIENGEQNLTLATLLRIAEAHGVTIATLLDGVEDVGRRLAETAEGG